MGDSKQRWRDHWKVAYPREPAVRARLSDAICRHILAFDRFQRAPQVALFSAPPWEPDLTALWKARPDACVFPRSDARGISLVFYSVASLGDLRPGYLGILEPPADEARRVRAWGPEDLICVPGRAFDRFGGRVGGGMGFYDRFLEKNRAYRLGVAFDGQVVAERLAQTPTDARMESLCTESGILRISG